MIDGNILDPNDVRWVLLEDNDQIREAMARDFIEELKELNVSDSSNIEENEVENVVEEKEFIIVPSSGIIAYLFNEVESVSRKAGVSESSMHLRKAKRAVIEAHDTRRKQ